MGNIRIITEEQPAATLVSNQFIDHYMAQADGNFIKVYLYLLRITGSPAEHISMASVAQSCALTKGEVLSAFSYWEQKGLLVTQTDQNGTLSSVCLCTPPSEQTAAATAPEEPDSLPEAFMEPEDNILQTLCLIAEQYCQRPLTELDVNRIAYFYEDLNFSPDLIEYLYEHCATIGNCSTRYVETVAVSWADKGISTVEQAKQEGQQFKREFFTILKAYGIMNRMPIDNEVQYMKRWLNDYKFTTELICEACQRTIAAIGSPKLAYTDSILKNWKEHGVLAKCDLMALDNAHHAQKSKQAEVQSMPAKPSSRFNNFEQRTGYNFEELEKKLNHT